MFRNVISSCEYIQNNCSLVLTAAYVTTRIYERLGIDIFDQNTTAFKEVAIICHPPVGEYAMGFITSSVVLQRDDVDEELCSVYVPTNHFYIGHIFLVNSEILRPNLFVREGIGMSIPLNKMEQVVYARLNRAAHSQRL